MVFRVGVLKRVIILALIEDFQPLAGIGHIVFDNPACTSIIYVLLKEIFLVNILMTKNIKE